MADLWVWVAPKLGRFLVGGVFGAVAWYWIGMVGELFEASHARRQAEIEARERRIRDFDRRTRRVIRDALGNVYGGGGTFPGWTVVDHVEHSDIAISFQASNNEVAVRALLTSIPRTGALSDER